MCACNRLRSAPRARVADDLGYNDVQFHGSPQIPTPRLNALAASGLTLTNYHAQPVCSPTRASILSGRHAIHHGIYMPFAQVCGILLVGFCALLLGFGRLSHSATQTPQRMRHAGAFTAMTALRSARCSGHACHDFREHMFLCESIVGHS